MNTAEIIYNILTHPIKKEALEEAYKLGMLKKVDLEDGTFYFGCCRNTETAQWSKADNCFKYTRLGHFPGDEYEDTVEHPEDDQGSDIFVPIKKVTE